MFVDILIGKQMCNFVFDVRYVIVQFEKDFNFQSSFINYPWEFIFRMFYLVSLVR